MLNMKSPLSIFTVPRWKAKLDKGIWETCNRYWPSEAVMLKRKKSTENNSDREIEASKQKKEEKKLDVKQRSSELKICHSSIIFLKYLNLHLQMLRLWRRTYDELIKIYFVLFFICVSIKVFIKMTIIRQCF